MKPPNYAAVTMLGIYAAVPPVATLLAIRATRSVESLVLDVALSTLPLFLLASVSWRLVWPRWKLYAKLLIQPFIYLLLSVYLGHWTILVAWIHQGVFGLGIHIWFCRKHGFTWYAVEDVERYVSLSKKAVGIVNDSTAGDQANGDGDACDIDNHLPES